MIADVSRLSMRYETLDGVHPTVNGHKVIADAWMRCLGELGLLKPSPEKCIKMYNVSKNDSICFDMVLKALFEEKVLMMFQESGMLAGTNYNGKIMIPVFTTPNEMDYKDSIMVRTVFLAEYTEKIKSLRMDILVNPFSTVGKQCIIPYVVFENLKQ